MLRKAKRNSNILGRFLSSSAMSSANDSTFMEWKRFWFFTWHASWCTTMILPLFCITHSTLWFISFAFSEQSSPTVGGASSRRFCGFQLFMLLEALSLLLERLSLGIFRRGNFEWCENFKGFKKISFCRALTILGLFLIALGSGGIKPCVAAFGGEQFKLPEQAAQLAVFFSAFYFSINAGSLISTSVTPILREDVKCFGMDDCFPLAFGVPAILMALAIIIFVTGKPLYKILPNQGNMLVKVCSCIFVSLIVQLGLK